MLFGDLPRLNAARYPNKTAYIDGNTRLTWSDVDNQANRFANALLDLGALRGDRLAMITANRHEWLIVAYGAAKVGVVVVPIGTYCTPDEILFAVDEAETSTIVVDERNVARVDAALGESSAVKRRIVFGDASRYSPWLSYTSLLRSQSERPPTSDVQMDDDLIVIYTSGSTGRPKGIVLTHRAAIALGLSNVIGFKTQHDDIGIVFPPMNHKGSFHVNKLHTVVGGTIVILNSFEVRQFLSTIQRERVTDIIAFPSMFQDMFCLPDFEGYDLTSLRRVLIAGTVMTRGAFEEAMRRFPNVEFQHAYGLTDAGGLMTVLAGKEHGDKLGSVGKALPNIEVQVHDKTGKTAPTGIVGEIVCRADSIMRCYLKRPELTQETLRDGWLHTGDLGKFDEDGYLWMVGRLKDLIKTGGENVAPIEVEDVLSLHPAVSEVAVFGVPDERWGEAVTATVVLRSGQSATAKELIDFCGARLSPFKKPKQVHFFDSLPKNPIGAKVLKDVLRERLSS